MNQKFDLDLFNKTFTENAENEKKKIEEINKKQLELLNSQIIDKKLLELTLLEILIGIKNSWFGLFDDILSMNYNKNMLFKSNRMFFIGVSLLIFQIIILVYANLLQ